MTTEELCLELGKRRPPTERELAMQYGERAVSYILADNWWEDYKAVLQARIAWGFALAAIGEEVTR